MDPIAEEEDMVERLSLDPFQIPAPRNTGMRSSSLRHDTATRHHLFSSENETENGSVFGLTSTSMALHEVFMK